MPVSFFLAPHGASLFFYVLRSFIFSFFIQQVFLSICHAAGLFKEWGHGWSTRQAKSLWQELTFTDLQIPEHNRLDSFNLFCCRLNIKQFLKRCLSILIYYSFLSNRGNWGSLHSGARAVCVLSHRWCGRSACRAAQSRWALRHHSGGPCYTVFTKTSGYFSGELLTILHLWNWCLNSNIRPISWNFFKKVLTSMPSGDPTGNPNA